MTERSIAYQPVADLVDAVRNPKQHHASLGESVERFGFVEPITVDERTGRIVSGHGRRDELLARQARGEAPPDGVQVDDQGRWMVPVVHGWASADDAEAEAFVVAANRVGEAGGWNDAALADLLTDLAASDLGLTGVGYSTAELDELLVQVRAHERHAPEPQGDPDDVPPVPTVPVSQPGDLWLLGRHRVLVGDATSEADHATVLDGRAVDLVLTDPPYGVGVDYGEHMDDTPEAIAALVAGFMPLVLVHQRALITSGVFQMWTYPRPAYLLAWVHPAGSGTSPWGFTCLNPVLAYGRDPYLAAGLGRRPDTLVLATDRQGVDGHPAVKPVEVWRWLVERGTTAEGQTVLDPFLGSGTTVIACELTGRTAYGIELSPGFVDVACRRYEAMTGDSPILAATGEPHSFLDV